MKRPSRKDISHRLVITAVLHEEIPGWDLSTRVYAAEWKPYRYTYELMRLTGYPEKVCHSAALRTLEKLQYDPVNVARMIYLDQHPNVAFTISDEGKFILPDDDEVHFLMSSSFIRV